jgi:hypothetical protein
MMIRIIKEVKEDMQKQVTEIEENMEKHLKKAHKQQNELKENTII